MPILALGGAIVGSIFASKAAGAQTKASMNAAQLEAQSAREALDFQKEVYGQQQKNIALIPARMVETENECHKIY